MPVSNGPANRAVLRMIAGNACGSGTICGLMDGGSLGLTNAHVVGNQVGRKVRVEVESLGMRRLEGTVIRAAYNSGAHADWAVVHIPGLEEIAPVYLTKKPPPAGYSLYTKGFPKCQPHAGTDITQQRTLNDGVLLWLPNSIGGQSGSGVIGDDDHLIYALLTWSMRYGNTWFGAGQLTSEIYSQNRNFLLTGALRAPAKRPGWEYLELPCENCKPDEPFGPDPVLENGIDSLPIEQGIQDLPIWYEDQAEPPEPPPPTEPGDPDTWYKRGLEFMRNQKEQLENEISKWEKGSSNPIDPPKDPDQCDDLFGL